MKKKNYVIPTIELENIENETILIGSGNIDINCKCNGKWCDRKCTIGCTNGNSGCNTVGNNAKETSINFLEFDYE